MNTIFQFLLKFDIHFSKKHHFMKKPIFYDIYKILYFDKKIYPFLSGYIWFNFLNFKFYLSSKISEILVPIPKKPGLTLTDTISSTLLSANFS